MALGYRRSLNSDWFGINTANVIHDSIGLSNPYLLDKLPELKPKNLRYPAGGTANWWDWKTSWFVTRPDLPPAFEGFETKDATLENLKQLIDSTQANAILCVNMLTSSLQNQIAMLKHADSIGIAVSFVELGSEFYLEGGDDSIAVITMFPTAQSYADSASRWADTIHHYFPNANVAAQGAFNRNNALRRKTWDENMFPTLHGENTICYHTYMSADEFDEDSYISQTFTVSDLPVMLGRPFKMWSILSTEDFPLIPQGKDIWITEYNLRDHSKPVHGCWGHGLFLATQTMQFLNDSRISHLACHDACGNVIAAAYFNTVKGYNFGNAGNFYPPPNAPPSTQYWGLTPGGYAMQQLGLAVKDARYASPIEFKYIPFITAFDGNDTVSYPSVYGWAFMSDNSTQALIVNLSATDVKVKTDYIFPSGGTYKRFYADPMLFVAYEDEVSRSSLLSMPSELLIKAYSITRLIGSTLPDSPPTVSISVIGSASLCLGDSVQLDAGPNYGEYRWSTGDSSQTIWAKVDGDYWVHVRNIPNGYYAGDSVYITVHALPDTPTIGITGPSVFCQGKTTILSSKKTYFSYLWSNGGTTSDVTVGISGNYTLTGIDSNGCTATSIPKTITVNPLPDPTIIAEGPTEFCYKQSVNLSVAGTYNTYWWSTGNWGKSREITETGDYFCTVTDFNGCTGISNFISTTVHEPEDPTITVFGSTTFCNDSSYSCKLSTIGGYSYQWQKAGTLIPGATKRSYIPTLTRTYKVIITDDWGCTKLSEGTKITVNSLPATAITVTGGKNYCLGDIITLSAKAETGYTYQWKRNGTNISGAILPTYLVTSPGDYTYAVTDLNGCNKTSNTTSITSNNCRENDNTGSQNEINTVNIYPNPATDEINVELSIGNCPDKNFTLEIRNLLGDMIYKRSCVQEDELWSGELKLNDDYSNGIYFVIIKTADAVFRKQFVVHKN